MSKVNIGRMAPKRFAALASSINFSLREYYEPRKVGYDRECHCGECCRRRANIPDERLPTVDEVIQEMKRRLHAIKD
jgi:hypothetical protein